MRLCNWTYARLHALAQASEHMAHPARLISFRSGVAIEQAPKPSRRPRANLDARQSRTPRRAAIFPRTHASVRRLVGERDCSCILQNLGPERSDHRNMDRNQWMGDCRRIATYGVSSASACIHQRGKTACTRWGIKRWPFSSTCTEGAQKVKTLT